MIGNRAPSHPPAGGDKDGDPDPQPLRARLLAQRYAGAEHTFGAQVRWNSVVEALLGHRSVRSYRVNPLPTGTLETLIAAAQSASTSSNLQAWSVIAVEEPARKARLATLAANQAHVRECPLFLVWLADLHRLEQLAHERGLRADGLDYLESFVVAVIDAALAAQNAVVAAESLGLGTVYIGAIRNRPADVAAELGLPPRVFPVFGLCVGFPSADRPPAAIKPRLPQELILYRERYDASAADPAAIELYDQRMTAFARSQGMSAAEGAWSERSARRISAVSALSGRHELAQILHALGFPLS